MRAFLGFKVSLSRPYKDAGRAGLLGQGAGTSADWKGQKREQILAVVGSFQRRHLGWATSAVGEKLRNH